MGQNLLKELELIRNWGSWIFNANSCRINFLKSPHLSPSYVSEHRTLIFAYPSFFFLVRCCTINSYSCMLIIQIDRVKGISPGLSAGMSWFPSCPLLSWLVRPCRFLINMQITQAKEIKLM